MHIRVGFGPGATDQNDDAYSSYKGQLEIIFSKGLPEKVRVLKTKPNLKGIKRDQITAKFGKTLAIVIITVQDGRCASYWFVGPPARASEFRATVGLAKTTPPPKPKPIQAALPSPKPAPKPKVAIVPTPAPRPKVQPVPAEVVALITKLKDTDVKARRDAGLALSEIGPRAAGAVPTLIQVIKDKDIDVRRNVTYALGTIGPAAKDAVPVLVSALEDKDTGVRAYAAFALGEEPLLKEGG